MIQSSVNQIIGSVIGGIESKQKANEASLKKIETANKEAAKQAAQQQNIAAYDKPIQQAPLNDQMSQKALGNVSNQLDYEKKRNELFAQIMDTVKNTGRHGKGQAIYKIKGLASEIEKMEDNK